jgi:hypothetical protein
MKEETKFRMKVDPLLEEIPHSWWESISQKSIRGTPDKIGLIRGRFVALEFKKDEKSPLSALQDYKLKKIALAGGKAYRVSPENWASVYKELKELA